MDIHFLSLNWVDRIHLVTMVSSSVLVLLMDLFSEIELWKLLGCIECFSSDHIDSNLHGVVSVSDETNGKDILWIPPKLLIDKIQFSRYSHLFGDLYIYRPIPSPMTTKHIQSCDFLNFSFVEHLISHTDRGSSSSSQLKFSW